MSEKGRELERKLRVIFFGHSGLRKQIVLERLAAFTREKLLIPGSNADRPDNLVRVYDAESKMDMNAFLPGQRRYRSESLTDSISTVLEEINSQDPKVAFLSLHLTYFYNTVFSTLPGLPPFQDELLIEKIRKKFRPDLCVTLIGDVYHAWSEIKPTYGVTLRDLLVWRNIESSLADDVARRLIPSAKEFAQAAPFEFSPIVSVMQPPITVFRYLFEPNELRLYASFPITKPRHKAKDRAEIDDFRMALHEQFTVFDPLAIDELPLEKALEDGKNAEDTTTLRGSTLWPLPPNWSMSTWARKDISGLPRAQINEIIRPPSGALKSPLRQQVEERDFRLIDQSDCVVIYRPQFGGSPEYSHGTQAEMWYAQMHGKRRILIHDEADGALPSATFVPSAPADRFIRSGLSDPAKRRELLREVVAYLQENRPRILAARNVRKSVLVPSM